MSLLGLLASLMLCACGTSPEKDSEPTEDSGAPQDVVAIDSGALAPDTAEAQGGDVEVGEDAAEEDASDPEEDTAGELPCDLASAEAGECGWPCAQGKDCFSGVCMPIRETFICAMSCDGDTQCPYDWTCRQVGAKPDVIYACVAPSPNLGRPCVSDLDCVENVGETVVGLGDKCVSFGAEGAFCGRSCATGAKCPEGFSCKVALLLSGEKSQQCVAANVKDNCTERFEAPLDGNKTVCRVSNEIGECSGKRWCAKGGLTKCDALQPSNEKCDGVDNDCDGTLDELSGSAGCLVVNQHGKCPGTPVCQAKVEKCLGTAPTPEACDGVDNNCDGATDEGCDDDKDGYCDAAMLFDPGANVCAKGGGDCDDKDAGVHPGQKEVCNGVDDNCDKLVDAADPLLPVQDLQSCEQQAGVCKGATKSALLCQNGKWLPCDAEAYTKHSPFYSAKELCDDKDNDCSGKPDEGCDSDKDGYCAATKATVGFPLVCPKGGGDCDDELKSVHPNATEHCDDADNDCNGSTDDGCDKDGDGWCDGDRKTFGGPKICKNGGDDCDDLSKAIHPKADELCNAVDDDCNGQTDEDFKGLGKTCSPGTGACKSEGKAICSVDGKSVVCSVAPAKKQVEICDDADNDCDGKTDEGCDDDLDEVCDASMATLGKPKTCVKGGGDCDDQKSAVRPGAKEQCNGIDDDCDGKTDGQDGDLFFEGAALCELQQGVCKGSKKPLQLCVLGQWQACSAKHYAQWHPQYGVQEVCDNVDNDCDGKTDEGCDDDGDQYCAKGAKIIGFPAACKLGAGDCDDDNKSIHPFASEICDGKDNDCDGKADEGCDKDFDDFCDADRQTIGTPVVCHKGGGDCDDNNPLINPGKQELCGDFIDQDCKKGADQGCPPTIVGFQGTQGPSFYDDKLLQCAGYLDVMNKDDVPPGWGLGCAIQGWDRIRIACGASPKTVRWIEMAANPFRDGIPGGEATGKITKANFKMGNTNLIKAINGNPNQGQSWWVNKIGCGEQFSNLIVNHPSCTWEVSNCFGQNLSGPRYLFVYVGK